MPSGTFWKWMRYDHARRLDELGSPLLLVHEPLETPAKLELAFSLKPDGILYFFSFTQTADALLEGIHQKGLNPRSFVFIDAITSGIMDPRPKPGVIYASPPGDLSAIEKLFLSSAPRQVHGLAIVDGLDQILLRRALLGQGDLGTFFSFLAEWSRQSGVHVVVFWNERTEDPLALPLGAIADVIRFERSRAPGEGV